MDFCIVVKLDRVDLMNTSMRDFLCLIPKADIQSGCRLLIVRLWLYHISKDKRKGIKVFMFI